MQVERACIQPFQIFIIHMKIKPHHITAVHFFQGGITKTHKDLRETAWYNKTFYSIQHFPDGWLIILVERIIKYVSHHLRIILTGSGHLPSTRRAVLCPGSVWLNLKMDIEAAFVLLKRAHLKGKCWSSRWHRRLPWTAKLWEAGRPLERVEGTRGPLVQSKVLDTNDLYR